ncbi:MAG: tRNA lysidine(34) synthetase TilS [Mycoplasmatales bacterium]
MKLLAVSGGVDSMVLLDKCKTEEIGVIHINHHTRGLENTLEENLVKDVCAKYEIPCYVYNYYYDGQGNFQQKAREFRYHKFKELCQKKGYTSVLLAHHFDVQIENILMNPQKIGQKIMDEKSKFKDLNINRPLLKVSKNEIYQYAQEHDVKYYEDSSNKQLKYLRNQIRNKLLNYTAEQKQELLSLEEQRYQRIKTKIANYTKQKNIELEQLKIEEDVYAFLKAQQINSNISLTKVKDILKFLQKQKNGEIRIDKSNKLVVAYNQVKIIHLSTKTKSLIAQQDLKIGLNCFNDLKFQNKNLNGTIRTFKKSDKINLKKGTKKINRIFIDNKIPQHLRKKWPIIVDKNDKIIKIVKKEEILKEL